MLSQLSYTPISFLLGLFFFSGSIEPHCELRSFIGWNSARFFNEPQQLNNDFNLGLMVFYHPDLGRLRLLISVTPIRTCRTGSLGLHRKEVIQPLVLERLPCYDFTPVAYPTFGTVLLAVRLMTSGVTNSHGVTGGVYKARERIHRGMLIRDY